MVKKCAAAKYASGCSSNEKKEIAKFYFSLKNSELNKQWIRFPNRRDWLAMEHLVLC